jgi:hypothetical protein
MIAGMDGDWIAALRAGVEGLEGQCHDGEGLGCRSDPCVENVSRAEVLALIEDAMAEAAADEDERYDPLTDQRFRAQLERDGAKIGEKGEADVARRLHRRGCR